MKLFIVLSMLLATSFGYVVKTETDLELARTTCIKELEIPTEVVTEYKKKIFAEKDACYIRCVVTKLDMYNDETGYLVENLITQLKVDRTDDVRSGVMKCLEYTETDKCLRPYRGFICLAKNGLLPKGV